MVILKASELTPGLPVFFPFIRDGEELTGFALCVDAKYVAYVNRCPHVPYSLDWDDGDIMDPERKFIVCQTHGARFRPASGTCFWGPPQGRRLEALPCRIDGDKLVITITPEPEDWP
jgi:nitrite reductase/ring-hydroxylating ferredoxin subunit